MRSKSKMLQWVFYLYNPLYCEADVPKGPWDQDRFKELLAKWIVTMDQPFYTIKESEFCDLLMYIYELDRSRSILAAVEKAGIVISTLDNQLTMFHSFKRLSAPYNQAHNANKVGLIKLSCHNMVNWALMGLNSHSCWFLMWKHDGHPHIKWCVSSYILYCNIVNISLLIHNRLCFAIPKRYRQFCRASLWPLISWARWRWMGHDNSSCWLAHGILISNNSDVNIKVTNVVYNARNFQGTSGAHTTNISWSSNVYAIQDQG